MIQVDLVIVNIVKQTLRETTGHSLRCFDKEAEIDGFRNASLVLGDRSKEVGDNSELNTETIIERGLRIANFSKEVTEEAHHVLAEVGSSDQTKSMRVVVVEEACD